MATSAAYPVQLSAELDQPLSRGLWLVKWLLAIPHLIVLFFLWVAFAVLSVVAFFAILITGRYPRAIFEFNVGVMRWSWRVAYYAYAALGTDRYPPFTLADVPDYPAHLTVDYPERLSRGLVLVKWWLLAIPHYVVVAVLAGGAWAGTSAGHWDYRSGSSGLIGILVLVAAVVLLFTGAYPRPVFDFVLGLNRWVIRVAGYAVLMTDAYPPFRLDMGGADPGVAAPPPAGPGTVVGEPQGGPVRWGGGRVAAAVVGGVLALGSLGLLAGGAAALWADRVARDSDGYVATPTATLSTGQYALTSDRIDLGAASSDATWVLPDRWLGTIRLRATPTAGDRPVFLGVGRTADVDRYLSGVGSATVTGFSRGTATYREQPGGAPAGMPADQSWWAASVTGTGTQTLTWRPEPGRWTLVVMNADAASGVAVRADAAATAPALGWLWVTLLASGFVLLVVAAVVIVATVASASSAAGSSRSPGGQPPGGGPPFSGPPASGWPGSPPPGSGPSEPGPA